MRNMDLKTLFSGYAYEIYTGENCQIDSIMIHSSQKKENALFFARAGERADGADYIKQAVNNGAVAVCTQNKEIYLNDGITYINVMDINDAQAYVSARLYNYSFDKIKAVGVTGTNGKTSFVAIASQLFNLLNQKSANTGTVGTNITADELFISHNTTYEPAIYNELLYEAQKQGYQYIFSEISSQGIALKRINYLSFYCSVFLNLTKDHLDFHKTMQRYFEAKKQLFFQTKELCIVNISDHYGFQLARELKNCGSRVITFGRNKQADYQILNTKITPSGVYFTLITTKWLREIFIPLLGEFNVYNILPAIILAEYEGFSIDEICTQLQYMHGASGRLELIYEAPKIYIDYAHTPDALENVLKVLKKIAEGKIIVVFGCGGNRDKSKRSIMGKIASVYADHAIITSDNPRNEAPNMILSDILMGFETENYTVIPSRSNAIRYALDIAEEKDIVLIAGKGHEEYQIIKNVEYQFSDRQCVNDYFAEKKSAI